MQAENLDQNTLNPTTTMSSPDTCTHILTLTQGRKEEVKDKKAVLEIFAALKIGHPR